MGNEGVMRRSDGYMSVGLVIILLDVYLCFINFFCICHISQ